MINIMRESMASRSDLKEASLRRILTAGASRLRVEGLSGAAIAPVMQEAGLTHGAFYGHFNNKEDLAAAAFRFALVDNRPRWTGQARQESWPSRVVRLGKRYLTIAHRDDLADSCALAALASDAARSSPGFKKVYEEELRKSLRAICIPPRRRQPDRSGTPERRDSLDGFVCRGHFAGPRGGQPGFFRTNPHRLPAGSRAYCQTGP